MSGKLNCKILDKDHYDRMVGLIVSDYLNTEKYNYHGNHLAAAGLKSFLQELGEWENWMEEEHEKVKQVLI